MAAYEMYYYPSVVPLWGPAFQRHIDLIMITNESYTPATKATDADRKSAKAEEEFLEGGVMSTELFRGAYLIGIIKKKYRVLMYRIKNKFEFIGLLIIFHILSFSSLHSSLFGSSLLGNGMPQGQNVLASWRVGVRANSCEVSVADYLFGIY